MSIELQKSAPAPVTPVKPRGNAALFSVVGVLLVAGVLVVVNMVSSIGSARLDWTENKAHSLSKGTEAILSKVDTEVKVQLFVSPLDNIPPPERPVVGEVLNMLERYRERAPKFIKVEKSEVPPVASDELEEALRLGISNQQGYFFGISVKCADTVVIPSVPALLRSGESDNMEYHLSRAISRVSGARRATLGIMSSLKLHGDPSMGLPPSEIFRDLMEQYDIRIIDPSSVKMQAYNAQTRMTEDLKGKAPPEGKIPSPGEKNPDGSDMDHAVDSVLVVHPGGISDLAMYALDQYILRGGRAVMFLDPHNSLAGELSRNAQRGPFGGGGDTIPSSSSVKKLLDKWGYTFDETKLVADAGYQRTLGQLQNGTPVTSPVMLTLDKDAAINDSDLVSKLTNIEMAFAGAFSGTPATGLTELRLLQTSKKADFVGTEAAVWPIQRDMSNLPQFLKAADTATRQMKPDGIQKVLALRLTGTFKTAFEGGKPPPPPEKPAGGMPGGMQGMPPGMFGPQGAQGDTGAPAAPSAPVPAETAPGTPAAPPAPAPATPAAPAPAEGAPAATPPEVVPAVPAAAPAAGGTVPVTPAPPPAGTPPATPATDTKPVDPNHLAEGSAEGLVYLISDADMLCDVMGLASPDNVKFAANLVNEASGDRNLMDIRNRATGRRPLTKLNEIRDEVNSEDSKAKEEQDAKLKKIQDDINAKKSVADKNNAYFAGMKALLEQEKEASAKRWNLEKEANKKLRSRINGIKWYNILIPPVVVAMIGLIVFIIRKSSTAAR